MSRDRESNPGRLLASRTPYRLSLQAPYKLGVCRKVTLYANVMKPGTVGRVRYVITLISFGPHRLTGFR